MTENKNLNHTFSSDVNMPLYLIRFESLYPLNNSVTDCRFFFFFFFRFFFVGGGGGGVICWSYVHHTVDMKILFLTLSVRLVVLLFFYFLVSMPYLMILSK